MKISKEKKSNSVIMDNSPINESTVHMDSVRFVSVSSVSVPYTEIKSEFFNNSERQNEFEKRVSERLNDFVESDSY